MIYQIFFGSVSLFIAYIAIAGLMSFYNFRRVGKVVSYIKPFERYLGKPKILIFGDSTAVGVGASSPEKSIAGLLGAKYPKATIINKASLGSFMSQVAKTISKNESADLIVVCCGGMDILYLKSPQNIRKEIKKILDIANRKAGKVVIITPINVGLSDAFPRFTRWFYKWRSNIVGRIFEEETGKYKNTFLSNNLMVDPKDVNLPWKKISSPDNLHPNDIGYFWAFERAKELL